MTYYSYELDQLVRKKKCVPYQYPTMKYRVGVTYWCGYWQKWFKVLDVDGRSITVKWSDGKIATHMTSLDRLRDYELRKFPKTENPVNDGESYTFAEIKAMCCAGVIPEDAAEYLRANYFGQLNERNSDKIYYFVHKREDKKTEKLHMFLRRDAKKSPGTNDRKERMT